MQPWVTSPLIMAQAFGYERSPAVHAAVRTALGAKAGVEGFAAAAHGRLASHCVRNGSRDDDYSRYVPLRLSPGDDMTDDVAQMVFVAGTESAPVVALTQLPRAHEVELVFSGNAPLPLRDQVAVNEYIDRKRVSSFTIDTTFHRNAHAVKLAPPVSMASSAPAVDDGMDTIYTKPFTLPGLLANCQGLRHVHIRRLPSAITTLGDGFALNSGVDTLDLAGLTTATKIGNECVSECPNLRQVDLSKPSAVQTIGESCLRMCADLNSVDLSGLTELTSIGEGFLDRAKALTNVNLSGLTNLTSVGSHFLARCGALDQLDLSSLSSLISVGSYFASDGTGLKTVELLAHHELTDIGQDFMRGCSGLQRADLSGLTAVTNIGPCFCLKCEALEHIDLPKLARGSTVGFSFLAQCRSLRSVDLEPLRPLTEVTSCFLYQCSGLVRVDLAAFSNVNKVDSNFLGKCTSLTSLDLSPLVSATCLGSDYLNGCRALRHVDVSGLTNVTTVGFGMMKNCVALQAPLPVDATRQLPDAVLNRLPGKLLGLKQVDSDAAAASAPPAP